MPRTVRTRSTPRSVTGSKVLLSNGAAVSTTPLTISRTSTCTDFHGRPVIDGTLSSDQYYLSLVLDGTAIDHRIPSNGVKFQNFPFGPVLSSVNTAHLVEPSDWFASTVARTNPSRPDMTPLTLIQDFKEIPAQLRDIGRLMRKPSKGLTAKEIANQHLALQFGWLPLIDDVKKLLDLQTYVLRRTKELRKLYSSTGLRRHIQLMDDTQSGQYTERTTLSAGSFFDISHNIDVKRKVWAAIKWVPTAVPPGIYQDDGMNKLARNVVLGWTQEGLVKGAWDVLPWTWMVNWFVNVGDFILMNSNTVPASHSAACLMNEVTVTCKPGSVIPFNVASCDIQVGGEYRYTSKRRALSGGVIPGFKLPYLDSFRLSILSALYVQRFVR